MHREWEIDTGDSPIKVSMFANTPPPIIRELLSKATRELDSRNYDCAVECLRQAYGEIAKTGIDYTINTFLRLPVYLQKAGRGTEAWSEFHGLLDRGYPNRRHDAAMDPMDHSVICDKMRLFLQREGKPDLAVVYGVVAVLAEAMSMSRQGRRSLAYGYASRENLADCARKLLKKAGKEHLMDGVVSAARGHTRRLSHIDVNAVKREMCGLLQVEDTYP